MARFDLASRWDTKEARGHYGCGIWKSILVVRQVFWEGVRFKLGDGSSIRFWSDVWVGESLLRLAFPNMYRLAMDPRALVANCFDLGSRVWDPRLRRAPND